MVDYKIGWGKPPEETRFKKGVSGNPKGRPKRKPVALAETIQAALNAPMHYRENGRMKTATRDEARLKKLIDRALKGDIGAIDLILVEREQAARLGSSGAETLLITDWLPDYPGQTAEQKTQEAALRSVATPLEWWNKDGTE